MPLKILLVDDNEERARRLSRTLAQAGYTEVSRRGPSSDLADFVAALKPDLVIMDMALPERDALEGVRALAAWTAGPIVMFADAEDEAFVEEAIAAGVSSYNLSGVSSRDMRTILASAIALYKRQAKVRDELDAAKATLEERRLIERAKAALMARRDISEPQAYKWLRNKAMKESRKLAQVAAEIAAEPIASRERKPGA